MDIERIWQNEKQLHALTGLLKIEADEILPLFEIELKQLRWTRNKSGGRPAKLDIKDIFVMTLMYYRHYDTLEALGAIFDLSDSNVKRWIDSSDQALRNALEKKSLSHLIAQKQKSILRRPLSDIEKSISMGLNNLFAGRKTVKSNATITQEKREDILQKYL